MNKGKLLVAPQRHQRSQRGVQREMIVEGERAVVGARLLDRDRRARIVISLLAVGYDDVEPVDGAAQHDDDETLRRFIGARRPDRTEQGRCSRSQRHAAGHSKKIAPVHIVTYPLYLRIKSGPPRISAARSAAGAAAKVASAW